MGRVQSTGAAWNAEGTRIQTRVIVAIEEQLKGDSGASSVLILVPGGEVGSIGQKVSGAPAFTVGERVFLFLQENSHGVFRIVGLFQGKYEIRGGETPQEQYVVPTAPLSVYDPASGTYEEIRKEKIPLEDFIREIQGYMRSSS
jgi:hypothetical protein